MNRSEILELLKSELKAKRVIHTLGVEQTAVWLAYIYGENIEFASTAALLHDCAKYMPTKDKLAICAKYKLEVTKTEKENPELLHAKAGALYAYEKYGIENREILEAFFYHTTGRPQMSLLQEIIFVSDYIEPNRTHSDSLPLLRELSGNNLELTVAEILEETLLYLEKRKNNKIKAIDSMTKQAFEYYKIYLEERIGE